MITSLFRQLHLLFDNDQTQSILEGVKFFFIVGLGRSGTTFLSHLLAKIPNYAVYHESKHDREALIKAYWDSQQADQYLSVYRDRLIASRILWTKCETYGEVNSYLRYHVNALQKRYNPRILHLVRDGRSVVPSIMNRRTFTVADSKHSGRIQPYPGTLYAERWSEMDRFSKACWYWAETNRHLLSYQLPIIRFEDVINSYELFSGQVLSPLELNLSFDTWNTQTSIRKNVSKSNVFGGWETWSVDQKSQFEEICGGVMNELGYVS